jgi:hypothetical protein
MTDASARNSSSYGNRKSLVLRLMPMDSRPYQTDGAERPVGHCGDKVGLGRHDDGKYAT